MLAMRSDITVALREVVDIEGHVHLLVNTGALHIYR